MDVQGVHKAPVCFLEIDIGYTGCNRRNVREFGRVFLRSNYTDITQNTYIQSSMVTEILAREKCGLLWCLRTLYSVHDVVLVGICLTTKGWTQLHCYVIARCSLVTLVRSVCFSV